MKNQVKATLTHRGKSADMDSPEGKELVGDFVRTALDNSTIEYAFDKLECKRVSVEGAKEKETRMILSISKGVDDEIRKRFHISTKRDPMVDYTKGVQLDVEEIDCEGALQISVIGSHGSVFYSGIGVMESARIVGETFELKLGIPLPGFTWDQFGTLWEHYPYPVSVSMITMQTAMFKGDEDAVES